MLSKFDFKKALTVYTISSCTVFVAYLLIVILGIVQGQSMSSEIVVAASEFVIITILIVPISLIYGLCLSVMLFIASIWAQKAISTRFIVIFALYSFVVSIIGQNLLTIVGILIPSLLITVLILRFWDR